MSQSNHNSKELHRSGTGSSSFHSHRSSRNYNRSSSSLSGDKAPSRRSSLNSSMTERDSSKFMSRRRQSGDTVSKRRDGSLNSSSNGEIKQIESYTNISKTNRKLKREVERMKKKVEADLEKQRLDEFANMHSVAFGENTDCDLRYGHKAGSSRRVIDARRSKDEKAATTTKFVEVEF
uniref:Uncharacterized protein n=1 Tax=Leptocylindrus danicus TaxID=163516 RepID=A0A7S2KS70_9STRA